MSSATERRWRRWAVGLALAWIVIAGAYWWKRQAEGRAAWQQVRERAAAIAAPFAATEKAHAPLLGEARPGEALAHYRNAARLVNEAVRNDEQEPSLWDILQLCEPPEQPDLPANAGERLLSIRGALEELAAGAASARFDARGFVDEIVHLHAEAVDGIEGPMLTATGDLVRAALTAARVGLTGDRAEEAVRLTVDALTLARDQLDVGAGLHEMFATIAIGTISATWNDGRLRSLPPAAQRMFASALQRFDEATQPASSCALTECLLLARYVSDRVSSTGAASQFAAYLDAVAAMPPPTAPWSVRERALAAAAACLPGQMASPLVEIERHRRAACAQVRLLRMALAHRLGEPLTPLADPLGDGPLLDTERGDERVLASRGGIPGNAPIERVVRVR